MFSKEKLVFDPAAAAETDNVGAYLRSADGTLLTHTDVGGKQSLDVNVANTVTVQATDLDIRDLSSATDSVAAVQSGAWEVSLDAATLAALETVTVEQGTSPWVVSATDFDIRNLDAAQDNVAINGISAGGNALVINADGSINANVDVSVVNGSDKAEDSAHVSGDIGTYVLAVRQDVLASSTSADGDYASFKVSERGAMWVQHDGAIDTLPGAYSSWLSSQNTVDTTAELVVAADLSNRKKILIQNVSGGGRTLYIGHANTVSAANGIRLSAGSAIELDLAAGVEIWAISSAAGADIRIAEFAAN